MTNIEASHHVLATTLKSVGVHGLSDSDEESNDSSVSSDSDPHGFIRARKSVTESVTESVDGHNPRKRRKRKGGWKKRTKLPYKSSLFYRDYHDPRVKVSGTPEAKEFRSNYRMSWIRTHTITWSSCLFGIIGFSMKEKTKNYSHPWSYVTGFVPQKLKFWVLCSYPLLVWENLF